MTTVQPLATKLRGKWLHSGHELFLLLIVLLLLGILVGIQPVDEVIYSSLQSLAILLLECILVLLIGQLVLQAIGGVLEAVACLDLFLLDFVLFRELLGLFDHTLNFLL